MSPWTLQHNDELSDGPFIVANICKYDFSQKAWESERRGWSICEDEKLDSLLDFTREGVKFVYDNVARDMPL